MATVLENLRARRQAVSDQIAQLSAANYDLPNASGPFQADLTGKIDSLYAELERLKRMIADEEGSWELPYEADT